MRLSALLAAEGLGLTLLVGEEQLDRSFERVFTSTLRDPRRYLTGGELVLSGMEWWPTPGDSEAFVAALAEADVAALGAGTAQRDGGPVPTHVVEACRRHHVPLIEVPVNISFATVSEHVILSLAAERAERTPGAGALLDRYRRLVAAGAEGGGVGPLVAAGAEELGATCWVLTATGRVLAGPAGPDVPDAPDHALLAGQFLNAERLPKVVPTSGGPVTLLSAAAWPSHRIVSWFLAAAGDHEDWESVRRELAGELATLVGLERARVDEARRAASVSAERVFRAALAGEVLPLAELDLTPADPVCVLSARLQGGSPGLAPVLLAELVGDRATVAEVDGETFAVVRISPHAGPDGLTAVFADVREAVGVVAPALRAARLSVGASGAFDAAALRTGLYEARHARKLAELSAGRVTVVAGDDVASHLLLLAAVPEELRQSFRSRVLGPVRDYDAAHRSELVHTLQVFLRQSGSWNRTAAELHLHVNTLRYRIGRIAELTGRDLSSFPDRVDLYLALDLRG